MIAHQGAKITKSPLREMNLPKEINIGGVIRNGDTIIPNGDTQIQAGDRVIVLTLPVGIKNSRSYSFSSRTHR